MRWNRYHLEIKSSILTVLCKREFESGAKAVLKTRQVLEAHIVKNQEFALSHAPLKQHPSDPVLIKNMCAASSIVNVGPMATVAGTIAEQCLKSLIHTGEKEAVVDNGGDIALKIVDPVLIGVYSGGSLPNSLAFQILPRNNVFGICTSAGTVGHSHSYGHADAATIFSENLPLADGAATALGNRVKCANDLKTCFDFLEKIPEIEGAMVVFNGTIALWGDVPKIVKCDFNPDLITRGGLI